MAEPSCNAAIIFLMVSLFVNCFCPGKQVEVEYADLSG